MFSLSSGSPRPPEVQSPSLAAPQLVLWVLIENAQVVCPTVHLPALSPVSGGCLGEISLSFFHHPSHTHKHTHSSRDRCLYSPGSKGKRVFPPPYLHSSRISGLRWGPRPAWAQILALLEYISSPKRTKDATEMLSLTLPGGVNGVFLFFPEGC